MGILTGDIGYKSGIQADINGQDFFDFCLKENHSVAIWRQPGEELINFVIQFSDKLP